MIEFIKSLFHTGAKPVPEVCDDCGRRPAVTTEGTLLLCAGCAYHEDDEDDEPSYYTEDGEP